MRKRALKKKRGELEALLADRREALGELVLGMHVRQGWDEDLMARGAAEVREVEESLAAVDEELGEGGETTDDRDDRTASREGSSDDPEQPTFETAEHTVEHDLPDGGSEPTGTVTAAAAAAKESVPAVKPQPPKEAPSGRGPSEPTPGDEKAGRSEAEATEPSPESKPDVEEVPAEPMEPRVPPTGTTPEATGFGEPSSGPGSGAVGATEKAATVTPKESPLDRLAARLDSEEKEARTGVEAARAAATADTRTETSAILESVERDRSELRAALTAAAERIQAAEKRAEEAEEAVARKEAENREAAAGWVRSQAAEIEADAALASEIAATEVPTGAAGGDTAALEAEIADLKAVVEAERAEKATAIAAAETRLREIESKAREAETRLSEAPTHGADSSSAAETREAAVDWLRGQIAALKREIESSSERSGD